MIFQHISAGSRLAKNLLLLLLLASLSLTARAETTFFVTPGSPVAVDSDLTPSAELLQQLEAGTSVTEVKRNQELGYSKIQLPDGRTGWIASNRLTDKEPTQTELMLASKELQGLSLTKLREELVKARGELNELRHIRAVSDQINADRENLKKIVDELTPQLKEAQERLTRLDSERDVLLFASGGLVLLSGIVIGIIFPYLSVGSRKKKKGLSF